MPDRAAIQVAVKLALVPIDEMSSVRYIHTRSLRDSAHSWATNEELDDYVRFVTSSVYGAELASASQSGRLLGAWVGGRLIGTAGWMPFVQGSDVARIRWCHVLGLYGRKGIGRRLLGEVEGAIEATGHTSLIVRATPNAVEFYERAGYGVTSYGTRLVPPDRSLPVAFLRKNLKAPGAATLF